MVPSSPVRRTQAVLPNRRTKCMGESFPSGGWLMVEYNVSQPLLSCQQYEQEDREQGGQTPRETWVTDT